MNSKQRYPQIFRKVFRIFWENVGILVKMKHWEEFFSMKTDFNHSETKINLLRAFAGESQARNRYTFAASAAKNANLHVLEAVFTFTADQEKEHAEIFYKHLAEAAGQNITIDAAYPVDKGNDVLSLLKAAQHNEYEEYGDAYPAFGKIAEEEGFPVIAQHFKMIAEIEKTHGDRFGQFAELLEQEKLFISDVETGWMCLNCGHVMTGRQAPMVCPVCDHNQGYFIRLTMAPFVGCNSK